MNESPASFYGERIPAQFNRALDRQQARGEAGRRVYEAMRAVDATIRVDVAGDDGGTFYLNIRAGRMSAEPRAAHAPFLTLIQDRRAFERLAHEAGDSALALLGGLAGLAGEIALTHARVESLRAVDGLVRIEVTGEGGFVLGTHFGAAPVPAEPKTRIRVDAAAYRDLRSGALDPQLAFMNEQIVVEGDMQAAMQLALAAVAPD
jgi:SCP-2 sterol transfer family